MRSFFRGILKNILGYLSRIAIKKHNTDLIIITGWTGTRIVRELAYSMLNDEFNVRRNTKEVWWDLSVPLNILGYDDRRRNVYEWIGIIFRSIYNILFKRKYPHKIIINIDTSIKDVAEFWSKYIEPKIVVVLKERPNSKLMNIFKEPKFIKDVLYVYNPKVCNEFKNLNCNKFKFSFFNADLVYKKIGKYLYLKYKNDKEKIKISETYKIIWKFIPAAMSIGLCESISLKILCENISQFYFHPNQIKSGISKLKEFITNNGEK